MKEETPYNPLDKDNLGASVADALLERSKVSLEDVEQFIGAGIYTALQRTQKVAPLSFP